MKNRIKLFLAFVLLTTGFSYLIHRGVVSVYTVHHQSMRETFVPGDRVIVVKFPFRKIRRDDIVLFRYNNENLIKRCIATPGDTVVISNGNIYVNHSLIVNRYPTITKLTPESRAMRASESHNTFLNKWDQNSFGPLVVPKLGDSVSLDRARPYLHIVKKERTVQNQFIFEDDYYFFVGDNRNESVDSRMFGLVASDDIIGICYKRIF